MSTRVPTGNNERSYPSTERVSASDEQGSNEGLSKERGSQGWYSMPKQQVSYEEYYRVK